MYAGWHSFQITSLYYSQDVLLFIHLHKMFNPAEIITSKFPYLTQSDLEQLLSITEMRKVEAGEIILKPGDIGSCVITVLEGLLRNYLIDFNEEPRTTLFTSEGHQTGCYAGILKNEQSNEFIIAIEPSVILVTDAHKLDDLAVNNINLLRVQLEGFKAILLHEIIRNQEYTTLSPEERFISFRDENPSLLQRVKQIHLASYLGITDISYSRIKARLLRSGI